MEAFWLSQGRRWQLTFGGQGPSMQIALWCPGRSHAVVPSWRQQCPCWETLLDSDQTCLFSIYQTSYMCLSLLLHPTWNLPPFFSAYLSSTHFQELPFLNVLLKPSCPLMPQSHHHLWLRGCQATWKIGPWSSTDLSLSLILLLYPHGLGRVTPGQV